MQWAKVTSVTAEGAYIRLDESARQKPLEIPKGFSVVQGDRLVVEKVGSDYIMVQIYNSKGGK